MQITIKTKRGTVALSFQKLRLFRRISLLEERVGELERLTKKLVAEGVPARGAAEDGGRLPEEDFSSSDVFTEWTEGAEVAEQRRQERMRDAEERVKKGVREHE